MKIVKTLLYILIIINLQAYSKDYVIESGSNIWDEIHLNPEAKWALDGGIFQETASEFNIKNNGDYVLIVLDKNGELSSYNISIVNGDGNTKKAMNNIIVDNKAPQLKYSWDNVINQGSQVIVGPNSQLNWQHDEPGSQVNIYINDKLSETTNPIKITESMSGIVINTIDDFQNQAETVIAFMSDFIGPTITWELEPPSFMHNDQWYANKSAKINLQGTDSVSYWVDGQPIPKNTSVIEINNNSKIMAMDLLGNQTTENIQWSEDKLSPQLTVVTLGKTYLNPDKLKVKVGQKIYIQAKDDVVGVLDSEYYGNNRKWRALPKAFVFVDTGLYRLKLKSNNKLGNDLVTDIVFKIIK